MCNDVKIGELQWTLFLITPRYHTADGDQYLPDDECPCLVQALLGTSLAGLQMCSLGKTTDMINENNIYTYTLLLSLWLLTSHHPYNNNNISLCLLHKYFQMQPIPRTYVPTLSQTLRLFVSKTSAPTTDSTIRNYRLFLATFCCSPQVIPVT